MHPTLVVAADVGVRAPHAADAGAAPLAEMQTQKIAKYLPHLGDLEAQGITYVPIIF